MDQNKKFWDRHAKLYAPIQERSNKNLFGILIPRCGKYITKEMHVLELACGSGQFTLPLCTRAGAWEATDYSAPMVEAAKKRNIPGATFSVQDATDLPYEDGSFDLVLIANALHVMPEPHKALGEIHRVLKPGGILLAPTFVYEGKYHTFRLKLMELAGFHPYFKWTSEDLKTVIENAGFHTLEKQLIPSSPAPECFLAAGKTDK